ncbi:hypothetical protein AVEN_77370-1 [Araneus ventricosus]|uniref:Uncharacterized protein n=1 Tax=Araneus ventricosus TaxID=182803 RepID=A0A4Y2C938_ARAVE|nr:hypothetical protein AVEN_77370-1 [Araneus ventricosus]
MAGNRSLRDSSAQNVEITSKELCGLPSSLRAIQPRLLRTMPVQVQSLELRPDFKITDHENRDSNRNQTPNSISPQSPLLESSLRVLVVESSSRLPNSSLKIPLTIPSEAWPKG